MVKALAIGVSVLTGILIGRIQIIENHEAKEAIASSERMEQRLVAAKHDAERTRRLLDKTERQLLGMWRRLEPMLEDFAQADSLIDRDAARRRIQSLRWEMSTIDATINANAWATAARDANGSDGMRQAFIKANFGD
jgi:hypothetical protein